MMIELNAGIFHSMLNSIQVDNIDGIIKKLEDDGLRSLMR